MTGGIEPLASIYVLLVGLTVGSFLNVCIYRLPVGESVVRPASRCPSCRTRIRWYQNVPVLSWLALRGRCASCKARVSFRYPLVEAMTGVLALALFRVYGPTPAFGIATAFGMALLVLFFTDLDHQLLPDLVTLPGFALGVAVAWFNPFLAGEGWARIWSSLAGAAIGSGVLWGIGAIYTKLRGVEAMGLGDVKMMAMIGAYTGPKGVLFTIFFASLLGAAVGLSMIPLRGKTLRDTLPFGCFLAPAAFAALVVGRRAIDWYLSTIHFGS